MQHLIQRLKNSSLIVNDKIILKVNNQYYQLVEYHFHVPEDHNIYQSEIHYVFTKPPLGWEPRIK